MQKKRKKQAKNPFGLMKKKKKKEEEEEEEDEKQELEFAEGFRRIKNLSCKNSKSYFLSNKTSDRSGT